MRLLEKMIIFTVDSIKETNKNELEYLNLQLPNLELPFPKYSYSNIVSKLHEAQEHIRWGDDLSPQIIKNLQNNRTEAFYFITDWPTSIKPFYVKTKGEKDEMMCESFDLMYGSLEISSGSTRINRKNDLLKRMKKQGLNVDAFDYHLRVFDYGVPPHAGFRTFAYGYYKM
jgi:nondiscriminating aspartyl-tRNA synthetase